MWMVSDLLKNTIATAEVGAMMALEARSRAVALHGEFAASGPFAALLLERGLSTDHVRRCVEHFTVGLRLDMLVTMGRSQFEALVLDSEEALAAAGGEITYQVRVLTGDHTALKEGTPTTEHLCDVLAFSPVEAQLIACQMASAIVPSGSDDATRSVPVFSEVITDSTLTLF